jgi:heterodisulfide reductase subunit C
MSAIVFLLILIASSAFFAFKVSKMTKRPIAGFLHILIYVGFVLINVEVIEIVVDGIFGTHRFLSFLGGFYNFMIGFFEVLAFGVLLACVVFLIRRNVLKIKRFFGKEMTAWPKSDANIILVVEVLLMSAFLFMNAADYKLQQLQHEYYTLAGSFPISSLLVSLLSNEVSTLIFIERFAWWFHIVGILLFLCYLPFSKHFHIFLAFPNVYYSNIQPKGKFNNLESVKEQVRLMMDPNADPYAAPASDAPIETFGAKDVQDLPWVNIMQAYTCTECGRCSDVCPANQTGKLLSPRKIMMDVRDRAEELGAFIDKNAKDTNDGKSLFNYITPEELWACTTCNACTEACPVNNDPLSVIVDLRRYLVMEQSQAPQELNGMFGNVENNGAPWAFPAADRAKWTEEL